MRDLARHKLIKLAFLVSGVAVAAKLVAARRDQLHGLAEADVRDKIESRIPKRVPEDKRAVVADKVIAQMRTQGFLAEEPDEAADSVAEESDSAPTAEEQSDEGVSN